MIQFDSTITLGNIIEIVGAAGGGIWFLVKVLSKFDIIVFRLNSVETRMERMEDINMLPINERRRAMRDRNNG